jgi:signal transduction histidine kinase
LLVVGTSLAALLIYWPTRRRLRSLQGAAQSIGAGQSGARAIESGRDEVAMLAHAFNEMAAGLEERTQALVSVNESRRQLLADVSHELMTPLSAIRGSGNDDDGDVQLVATRQRAWALCSTRPSGSSTSSAISPDLARMEGGGGAWKSEPVAVHALFRSVQQRHEPLPQSEHHTDTHIAPDAFEVVGDPTVPSSGAESRGQCRASHARRRTRHADADRVEDGLRLAVEDSAPAFRKSTRRVFDRFYKVDVSRTGTKVPSGSGLGLSIVQAIVRRHGGSITAGNSEVGGARFEIVLPL